MGRGWEKGGRGRRRVGRGKAGEGGGGRQGKGEVLWMWGVFSADVNDVVVCCFSFFLLLRG